MDEQALLTALKTIHRGVGDAIAALQSGETSDEDSRDIALALEFDRAEGHGLTREEASHACRRHGFAGQKVSAWVRGEWLAVTDDRRYLTRRSVEWLSENDVQTKHPPVEAWLRAEGR